MNKQEFLYYFKSDNYSDELTTEEKIGIFLSCLDGSSDITKKLLDNLISQYEVENLEVWEKLT